VARSLEKLGQHCRTQINEKIAQTNLGTGRDVTPGGRPPIAAAHNRSIVFAMWRHRPIPPTIQDGSSIASPFLPG